MSCYSPLKAYRKPGGGIAFDSKSGYVDRPVSFECGQCIGCRVKRSREWALRCVHEAQMHERNSFVTLTYSPSKLPRDCGLDYRHFQLFAKRLRKRCGSFRFFACGEYGDVNLRPHFHACIFGLDFASDREVIRERKHSKLYYSKTLEDVWQNGYCTVGDLTYSSAAYVARYVLKKVSGKQAEEEDTYWRYDGKTGECWEVDPPFVRMSRGGRGGKGGIGSSWFEKFQSEVYPFDEVVHDGRRFRPPRYYDRKLEEEVLKFLKDKRIRSMMNDKEELTPARLKAREEFERRKQDHFKREL